MKPDSLVLLDSSLSSFLIPYFPRQTRFAGLEGTGSARFDDLVAARIAAHRGASSGSSPAADPRRPRARNASGSRSPTTAA